MTTATQMTLEELIDQQLNLGHKNPHEIPDLLKRHLGEELVDIINPYIDDFITELARQRLNAQRRQEVVKINKTSLASREIMLKSLWVPQPGADQGITYKAIGDMTADDFDARGDYLTRMATGVLNHAQWCKDVAQRIRDAGVSTAGQLESLPELHDINA